MQGVGFRAFVETSARALNVTGWVRNQDDGTVETFAMGTADQLNQLAARLHAGPRWAEVRSVEEVEAALQQLNTFRAI